MQRGQRDDSARCDARVERGQGQPGHQGSELKTQGEERNAAMLEVRMTVSSVPEALTSSPSEDS